MRLLISLLTTLATLLGATDSHADCVDPRGCFLEICSFPGNVVELTVVDGSGDSASTIIVRVNAVHIVDSRFAAPAVGSEMEISAWASREYDAGDRLVGLAREQGNVAWPLFSLSGHDEVGCLSGSPSPKTISISDVEFLVRLGRCDEGAPLPEPAECNDPNCTVGGHAPLLAAVVLVFGSWRRRKSGPKVQPRASP